MSEELKPYSTERVKRDHKSKPTVSVDCCDDIIERAKNLGFNEYRDSKVDRSGGRLNFYARATVVPNFEQPITPVVNRLGVYTKGGRVDGVMLAVEGSDEEITQFPKDFERVSNLYFQSILPFEKSKLSIGQILKGKSFAPNLFSAGCLSLIIPTILSTSFKGFVLDVDENEMINNLEYGFPIGVGTVLGALVAGAYTSIVTPNGYIYGNQVRYAFDAEERHRVDERIKTKVYDVLKEEYPDLSPHAFVDEVFPKLNHHLVKNAEAEIRANDILSLEDKLIEGTEILTEDAKLIMRAA